ncbi:hypothetical protein BS17DRAFT_810202 [Gyrodon lividus]|nr:hypothetical protein BS17DRAFT_810202 [Gyrodon lividus]
MTLLSLDIRLFTCVHFRSIVLRKETSIHSHSSTLLRTSVGTCQKRSEDTHCARDCETTANEPKSATVAKPHNTTHRKPERDTRRQGRVKKRGRGGKEEAGGTGEEEAGGTGEEEAAARRSGEDTTGVPTASVGLAVTPNSQDVDGKDPRVHHTRANPQKPIASRQTMSPVASKATADATNPNATSAGPTEPAGTPCQPQDKPQGVADNNANGKGMKGRASTYETAARGPGEDTADPTANGMSLMGSAPMSSPEDESKAPMNKAANATNPNAASAGPSRGSI